MHVVQPNKHWIKVLSHHKQGKYSKDILNVNLTKLENGSFISLKTIQQVPNISADTARGQSTAPQDRLGGGSNADQGGQALLQRAELSRASALELGTKIPSFWN